MIVLSAVLCAVVASACFGNGDDHWIDGEKTHYSFRLTGGNLIIGWRPSEPTGALNFRRLSVPLWALALALAVLPTVRLIRGFRMSSVEVSPLICLKCGYDLRASPDRCPECGTRT
jgi:hypothetical protein